MVENKSAGLIRTPDDRPRCSWCASDELYRAYHDDEWGRPVRDDRRLFEKLCLEGFQSGLSWLTILRKRENFRAAFDGFDFEKVARYGDRDIARMLADAGIVRHRGKIEAAIGNAKQALARRDEFGSLAAFFWRFDPTTESRPNRFDRATLMAITETAASKACSKELKKRGFRFVGATTLHAFHQAMGLVNDHFEGCHVRDTVESERSRFKRP